MTIPRKMYFRILLGTSQVLKEGLADCVLTRVYILLPNKSYKFVSLFYKIGGYWKQFLKIEVFFWEYLFQSPAVHSFSFNIH